MKRDNPVRIEFFSRHAVYVWSLIIFVTGPIIAFLYTTYPGLMPAYELKTYGSIFSKILKDYKSLAGFDMEFARQFSNFNLTLMLVAISMTCGFVLWNLVGIMTNGVRLDGNGKLPEFTSKPVFGLLFFTFAIYWLVALQTPFAEPGESAHRRIAMNSFGLYQWGFVFSSGIGMLAPIVVVGLFNRVLFVFGYKMDIGNK